MLMVLGCVVATIAFPPIAPVTFLVIAVILCNRSEDRND